MSLVRPVGFVTLGCGCRVGRYRDLTAGRDVAFVEAKGPACDSRRHRPNHPLAEPVRNRPVRRSRLALAAT